MSGDRRGREEIIHKWMDRVIACDGQQNYDDLHIDQIDVAWKPRDRWVSGGIAALTLALSLQRDSDRVIVLGLSLQAEDVNFDVPTSPDDLNEQLDMTPPSLYLFKKGEEFWNDSGCQIQLVDENFGDLNKAVRGVYMKFRHESSGEERRSFFLTGAGAT